MNYVMLIKDFDKKNKNTLYNILYIYIHIHHTFKQHTNRTTFFYKYYVNCKYYIRMRVDFSDDFMSPIQYL